jgi:Fe-S cluster biogenesis protein NfuA/nitrite reductase/ring-hydroxylating ferredoxin subunit
VAVTEPRPAAALGEWPGEAPAAVAAQAVRLIERVQELQERLERAGDSETKRSAELLISALVQMYGAGLEHLLELLGRSEAGREHLRRTLEEDELLTTLLLIHDLHPDSLHERVVGALEQVRPYMESHGGDVELLSLEAGVARIRLRGSCSDCAASSVTLELAIKQALEQAAPDLEGLEVDDGAPPASGMGAPLAMHIAPGPGEPAGNRAFELPMAVSGSPSAAARPAPAWRELAGLRRPDSGHMVTAQLSGTALVVANVEGTLLAYMDRCTACGAALHDGELQQGALRCAGCARTFFLPRAGRSLDDERVQLEPVPLLHDRGSVRVALA